MPKNETKERRGQSSNGVQRISTVDNPDQSGPGLFVGALVLILVAGLAGTVFFALNRESNIGVAPEANLDHWHMAFSIHECGADLPVTNQFEAPAGVHTHGDGLLHVHPFNPGVAGNNATLGAYFEAYDAKLTDSSFTPGFADNFRGELSEAEGCGGEEAVLQLGVWRNAFDETAEPEIITENIADFTFESAGMAITLALLPEGAEIPRPPIERIITLTETGPGGSIFGVEDGESPIVLDPDSIPADDTTDAESTDGESTDAEGSEDDADPATDEADSGADDAEAEGDGSAEEDADE